MNPLPRLETLNVVPPHTLHIAWKGGGTDSVDMTGLVDRFPPFEPLQDPALFAQIEIVAWGAGVRWPGDLDFSANSLKAMADEQRCMGKEDFIAWQGRLEISNSEAAVLLGRDVRTIENYRAGKPIPAAVQIACSALATDAALFHAHFRPRKPGRPRKAAAASAKTIGEMKVVKSGPASVLSQTRSKAARSASGKKRSRRHGRRPGKATTA